MSNFKALKDKLPDWASASTIVREWKANGKSIVFTNGCFDILHLGHLKYLAEASDLGDKLIIGINSDASVTRLKGKSRPIYDLLTRTHMLAAIGYVDMVVVFEEDTPLKLIETINPDILVKGGDWAVDQIVGAEFVKSKGGAVITLPFLKGYSTTRLVEKIKGKNQD